MTVRLHFVQPGSTGLPERLERKFYVPPARVAFALSVLRQSLRPASAYPCERISSLYFDTRALELYEQSIDGQGAKDKVRIRWYESGDKGWGDSRSAFVELKSRRGFASSKRRLEVAVPTEALTPHVVRDGIVRTSVLVEALAGFGYQPPGPLFPIVEVVYQRYRFVEPLEGLSVALDCRVRSAVHRQAVGTVGAFIELPGAVIEVKGSSLALPPGLQRMSLLNVDWTRFSKYVSCVDSHRERPGVVGHRSPAGRLVGL